MSIRKFQNEIVADGCYSSHLKKSANENRKEADVDNKSIEKRTKTINNAGRVECSRRFVALTSANRSTFSFNTYAPPAAKVFSCCTFDVLLRERLTHSHSIIYFLNIEFVFFFFFRLISIESLASFSRAIESK